MADLPHPATLEDGRSMISNLNLNIERTRSLARSPHPYHRRGASLHSMQLETGEEQQPSHQNKGQSTSNSSCESGTEADDERGRFLRSLPAPPWRPHKGLRNAPFEDPTPQPSPLGSPPAEELNDGEHPLQADGRGRIFPVDGVSDVHIIREKYTKRKFSEVTRRITETLLFFTVGLVVSYDPLSKGSLLASGSVIVCHFAVVTILYLLYPIHAACQAKRAGCSLKLSLRRAFHVPSRFDPAPLLYPVFLPLLVAISLLPALPDCIVANVILGMSSLPFRTVPFPFAHADFNLFHWLLTLFPLTVLEVRMQPYTEQMTLLYPLHICTILTIEFLSTTSLDPTERHLLAAALIDLYMFAESPQSIILKALLWLGTMLLFIVCQRPLQWEVELARIPSWRFRDSIRRPRLSMSLSQRLDRKVCNTVARLLLRHKSKQAIDSEDELDALPSLKKRHDPKTLSFTINGLSKHLTTDFLDKPSKSVVEAQIGSRWLDSYEYSISGHSFTKKRRHTSPAIETPVMQNHKTTPSGRPKRSITNSSQSFLALTPAQVTVRKWAYALFIYSAVLFIILGPIRSYIGRFSLQESEPAGWALGYLLGNIPPFRFWVLLRGLDNWIRLPDPSHPLVLVQLGWLERLRQNALGPANVRLLLCVYCLLVLLAGMAVVLKSCSIAEVDTRRKVFHGMMVVMFLPTVFIDPCFTSLGLVVILAIFLLLDLFRASQLPPISKPLTAFLAPFVDGRDHRGPVIVSHIFLLIGCAIPLWLSLAAVPRSGSEPWAGWDVNARDVSMVSGIVCVGMGDSAASLIGRRYGRHKWYWGGGKSLEGSLAFAAAVTVGLVVAYTWLRIGGWVRYDRQSPLTVLGKACLAASGASLTEAVLTGANDNVVVPVVLWLLVRGFRL